MQNQHKLRTLAAGLTAVQLYASSAAAQSTLEVPQQYATIQAAIDASASGDTVRVAPGIYVEHSISTQGKAIHLVSSAGAAETRIAATGLGRVFEINNGEGRDTVIEGFTIGGGRAPDAQATSSVVGGFGGGIRMINTSPTLIDVLVRNCSAGTGSDGAPGEVISGALFGKPGADGGRGGRGGGLFIQGGAPLLSRVRLENNRAGRGGLGGSGAAAAAGAGDGFAGRGGGGGEGGDGGAMWIGGGADVEMRSCTVWSNFSGAGGSGGPGGFGSNSAVVGSDGGVGGDGGDPGDPGQVGGIVVGNGTLDLLHCTVLDNTPGLFGAPGPGGPGGVGGPGAQPGGPGETASSPDPSVTENYTRTQIRTTQNGPVRLRASIVRVAAIEQALPLVSGSVKVLELSNVQGSTAPLVVDEDPQFSNAAIGNLKLAAGSPAIDRVPSPSGLAFDVAGQPRTFGAFADLGSNEFYELPGTDEDLLLEARVDQQGLGTEPYASAVAGQTYGLTLSAPNGTFDGAPALLAYQPFAFGGQLGPDLALAGLQLDSTLAGLRLLPFGDGFVDAAGSQIAFVVPPGLAGLIVRFQAAGVSVNAGNGIAALTEAKDVGLF